MKQTHRAFSRKPTRAFLLGSRSTNPPVETDLKTVLNELRSEVREITDMVEYQLYADPDILSRVASLEGKLPNETGRLLGYTLPKELLYRIGGSRKEKLFCDRLIREARSWLARVQVVNGDREASQGWERTANPNRPTELTPKISLSAVDKNYAVIGWEPELLSLRLVVRGQWYLLEFDYDLSRFNKYAPFDKITLPDIFENENGELLFGFTAAYEKVYPELSSRYVIGVDVGITSFFTAAVIDTVTKQIVYSIDGSAAVKELTVSCRATQKQIANLSRKAKKRPRVWREIREQRSCLSNKKRELAILAAQEVVTLSYLFGNAPIAVEDLSWIPSTMAHGRWNRGALVRWIIDYAARHGVPVLKVNSANTSQTCLNCGGAVSHPVWKLTYCSECGILWDRDVAASGVVAQRSVNYFSKAVAARKKHPKKVKRIASRVPKPDRKKTSPTPKRPKEVKTSYRCPLTGVTTPRVVWDAEQYGYRMGVRTPDTHLSSNRTDKSDRLARAG